MYFHFPTFIRIMGRVFSGKNFGLKHAFLAIVFLIPFLVLRIFIRLLWALDHLFFPGFSKQEIRSPVYIIGNPRSGTTFLHRLIASDKRFATFSLYQTIFIPISARRLIALGGRADRFLGGPVEKLLKWVERKGFGGWDTIHQTGSRQAESDEMLFMYAILSPLLGLLFPYFSDLEEAVFPDRLPTPQRRRLKAYYLQSLQRHLFDAGSDKRLLQKVALIAGRLETTLELFPDMKIVYLSRHPYESIPSLISMFSVTWRSLVPEAARDTRASRELAEMIFAYYRKIHLVKKTLPPDRFIEIRYEELVADPKGVVERIYERFGIEMTGDYELILTEEAVRAGQYRSRHRYGLEKTGITREMIYENLREIFEEYGFEK